VPAYRFFIHGRVALKDGIKGFYTTRMAEGVNEAAARVKALALLTREWDSGEYRVVRLGGLPVLDVEESWQIDESGIEEAPDTGYTFYRDL